MSTVFERQGTRLTFYPRVDLLTPNSVVAHKQSSVTAAIVPKPEQHCCAHCGREARLNCKACQGAPDSTDLNEKITVWYCGKDCQKNHWANHKPFCKQARARADICRIARLLQDLFYTFKRVANMWALGRIDKNEGLWILRPPSQYPWTSALIPFPPPCITTLEEENAILSYNSCRTALSYIHNVTALLLKGELAFANCSPRVTNWFSGYSSDIVEVMHKVKGQQLRLLRAFDNGQIDATDYSHLVLKITLGNGEQYAVDMTGAQYGWTEAILPWNFYSASRIRSIQ